MKRACASAPLEDSGSRQVWRSITWEKAS